MPRPSLNELRSSLEFQHTYSWECSIIRPPAGIDIDPERWNLQCVSHGLPFYNIELAEVQLRGHNILEPGRVTPNGELTITFVETTDAYVRNIVAQWEAALRDRTQPINALLGDFRLATFENDGETQNYSYDILQAFIENTSPAEFGGGDSEAAQWEFTLRYNDFRTSTPGTSPGDAGGSVVDAVRGAAVDAGRSALRRAAGL